MNKTNGNESITPCVMEIKFRAPYQKEQTVNKHQVNGLTKREYFSAMAMQALIHGQPENAFIGSSITAEIAVKMADVLISELNKVRET